MKICHTRKHVARIAAATAMALAGLFTATALSAPAASEWPDSAPNTQANPNSLIKSAGCPGGSVICFYDSTGFNNYIGFIPVSSCSRTTIPFQRSVQNRVESVRNRTGCRIYLLYYVSPHYYYQEAMVPHSDDGVIAPLNAIDAVGWTSP